MATRWVEALALFVLSGLAAGPVSAWFARARWPAREPVAALIAWQGIGLCGGLALLTSELTAASATHAGPWRGAVFATVRHPWSVDVFGAVALALFTLSFAWLVLVLGGSFIGAIRARRRHRALIELFCSTSRDAPAPRVAVLDAAAPVAYSLPGPGPSVVISTGTIAALSSCELDAVLAHERAHLTQRHNLLVQPFVAWERSIPFLHSGRAARRRVEQLAEMACDDVASRRTSSVAMAGALEILASSEQVTTERIELVRRRQDSAMMRVVLGGIAVALAVAPPVALFLVGR